MVVSSHHFQLASGRAEQERSAVPRSQGSGYGSLYRYRESAVFFGEECSLGAEFDDSWNGNLEGEVRGFREGEIRGGKGGQALRAAVCIMWFFFLEFGVEDFVILEEHRFSFNKWEERYE